MQESAIEEYFKPIDKEVEALMRVQLEGEERTMKNMVKVMQQQALLEKTEADKVGSTLQTDKNQQNQDPSKNWVKVIFGEDSDDLIWLD